MPTLRTISVNFGVCGSCGWPAADSRGKRGCLAPESMVLTPNAIVRADALSKGDMVTTFDSKRGKRQTRLVLDIRVVEKRPVLRVGMEGGIVLRSTASHSVRTLGGWQKVSKLKVGDEAITLSESGGSKPRRITSIELHSSESRVYKIIVARDFVVVADGVITHSFSNMRMIQSAFWRSYECARTLRSILGRAAGTLIPPLRLSRWSEKSRNGCAVGQPDGPRGTRRGDLVA